MQRVDLGVGGSGLGSAAAEYAEPAVSCSGTVLYVEACLVCSVTSLFMYTSCLSGTRTKWYSMYEQRYERRYLNMAYRSINWCVR